MVYRVFRFPLFFFHSSFSLFYIFLFSVLATSQTSTPSPDPVLSGLAVPPRRDFSGTGPGVNPVP